MNSKGYKLLFFIVETGLLLSCLLFFNTCRVQRISSINRQLLELPNSVRDELLIQHYAYTVSYNTRTLTANWVAYELTADETDGPWSRKGLNFFPDPFCNERQANHNDYRNSGYSRGHLAPAGDMKWDSIAMLECFYFTNCIPQDASLNTGKWNQLEEQTRRWARQYGKVYVICGPLYFNDEPLRIGFNGVAVPDACFKALLTPKDNGYSAIAFIMRNGGEERPVAECVYTVDELELILSMDLFFNLPNEQEEAIESAVIWEDWGFENAFKYE